MLKHAWIAIVISLSTRAAAGEQSCSFTAINAYLKADEEKFAAREGVQSNERTGIVPDPHSCPPSDQSGMLEYMDKYQVDWVDENTNAVLIDTHQCGGGNKHGQYFLISRGEKCDLVKDPEIGDMQFIADRMYSRDGVVYLVGYKWRSDDPHCCPSREGTLEYVPRTGRYSFNLHKSRRQ